MRKTRRAAFAPPPARSPRAISGRCAGRNLGRGRNGSHRRTMILCLPRSSWQVSIASAAVAKLRRRSNDTEIAGIETNLEYLRQLVAQDSFAARRHDDSRARVVLLRAADARSPERGYADHDSGLSRAVELLERRRAALRADGRVCRSGSRTGPRQPGRMPPRSRSRCPVRRSNSTPNAVICLTGAAMHADSMGTPIKFWTPIEVAGGSDATHRRTRGSRMSRLSRDPRRIRRAALLGQPRDVHLGPIRRARRPRLAGRRRLASGVRLERRRASLDAVPAELHPGDDR